MHKCKNKIHFETRLELRPDMAIVETFQDGSQLIRKNGFMVLVDSCIPNISNIQIKANVKTFSYN